MYNTLITVLRFISKVSTA